MKRSNRLLTQILDPFHVFAALMLAVGLWVAPILFHAQTKPVLASPLRKDCRVCTGRVEVCTAHDTCTSRCVSWAMEPCGGGDTPDIIPPTISGAISCTLGSNGWCVGNAQLILSASDPQDYAVTISGDMGGVPISCTDSCAVNLPEGSGIASYTVTAATSGQTASDSTAWRYDPIPPVSNVNLSGVSGSNGWYVSQVNASAGGSDSISGIASATLSVNGGAANGSALLSDGVHSVVSTARDVAGNTASRTQTISVDTLAPAISISAAGNQALDGWFTTAVDLSATASDATSGVSEGVSLSFDNGTTWEAGSRILDSGLYDVLFRVPDRAGNVGTSRMSLKIDTQPPTIILSEAGSLGQDGWYLSPATLSAAVGDNLSGITSIQYRVDSGAWQDGDSVTVQEGIHTIDFQAFDAAGNRQSTSREIRVDLTPPAYTFDAALNGAVLAETVALTGTVSDQTSTVQSVEFSSDGVTWLPVSFENGSWNFAWDSSVFDNGSHALFLRAADVAGNRGESVRITVVLDNDPPYVKVSETWNIWESGNLAVFDNVIPLESLRIVVHDPMLRFADQVIYDKLPAPAVVTWDRVIGPASAPPGSYTVTVEVCDIYDLCSRDTGTIVIPDAPNPEPVPTQSIEPKRKWWNPPIAIPRLPEPEQPIVVPAVVVPIQEEIPVVPSFPLWTMVVVSAFLLSFILLLLLDSRPKAWRSLTQRLADSMMSNE